VGQIVKVTAVPTTTTATLEIPLYKAYDKTPYAVKMTGITSSAGLENITLDSSAACADGNYGDLHIANAVNSWVLNVEINRVCRAGIIMLNSYRNTLRGLNIHESQSYTSNGGYGFWIMGENSANLIENSVFNNMLTGVIYTGPVSGNVFGYNYFTGMHNTDYPTAGWLAISSHGSEPWMNLFEGNYINGNIAGGDYAWGGAAYGTYFRNRITQKTSGNANTMVDMGFGNNDYYMNLIGNVLGTTGYETAYEVSSYYSGARSIFGFMTTGASTSALRHGNWDSYNNNVGWNGADDRTLPPSLYLTGTPSWWGNLQWPAIGPDIAPMYPAVPTGGSTPWGTKSQKLMPSPTMKSPL
jgi:hypothetical protein